MHQVFNSKGTIIVENVAEPQLRPGYLLVQNAYSVISSGTETSGIKSASDPLFIKAMKNPDLTMKVLQDVMKKGLLTTAKSVQTALKSIEVSPVGYSCAGTVIGIGEGVSGFLVGDRVACAGANLANHADIVSVPKNLVVKIPANVDLSDAAFTTVGAIAMQGLRRAKVEFGETIVVMGLGLLGQICVQLLKAAGCIAIGIDLDPKRVEIARSHGLDHGISPSDDPIGAVQALTSGFGADAVLVCVATQSEEPIKNAMDMLRKRGRTVLVGVADIHIPRGSMYEKETDFLISTSYGPGRYEPNYEERGIDFPIGQVRWTENRNMQAFVSFLERQKIDLSHLKQAVFPVEQAPQAYAALMGEQKPLAAVLSYSQKPIGTAAIAPAPRQYPVSAVAKTGVGVIGCGGFARSFHLPNISSTEGFSLRAVADSSGMVAQRAEKDFHAEYSTTDYHELMGDPSIQLIVITTRHNLHAPIALEAMEAGKHVFVEKPLAMNTDELNKILNVSGRTKKSVMVGFNRRFSPLSQTLKKAVEQRHSPLTILYRVNAGRVEANSWVNDPVEGGARIIGEACHFLDYVSWLVGSLPQQLVAEKLVGSRNDIVDEDNVTVTLTYPNGSLATVVYTTIGHPDLPKEHIEVFQDYRCAILDDYKTITGYGFRFPKVKQRQQDKGHAEEVRRLAHSFISGGSIPIPISESASATRASFAVLESLRSGRPVILQTQ